MFLPSFEHHGKPRYVYLVVMVQKGIDSIFRNYSARWEERQVQRACSQDQDDLQFHSNFVLLCSQLRGENAQQKLRQRHFRPFRSRPS